MANTDADQRYLAEKISKLISAIERDHWDLIMIENDELGYGEEYPGWTKAWLTQQLLSLYSLISVYLEIKQMPVMLNSFKAKFGEKIDKKEDLLGTEHTNPEGEPELIFITESKRILDAFREFGTVEDHFGKINILKSILRNTHYILKKIGRSIQNEAAVYNEIKWILGLYFPSARVKSKASFIHQFKTYNPDILIPEIKTAVEYKYIKTKKDNVDEYLDEIKVDSQNYIGDSRFESFIAVVYIDNPTIATPEHLEQSWKAKQMPTNWTLIVTTGSAEFV